MASEGEILMHCINNITVSFYGLFRDTQPIHHYGNCNGQK